MRFTHDPSSRNSITPEAMLAAIPSAAESRSASSRRHLPAASAAPNTPHTAVACQPRAWKRPGAAMPRRIMPSDPATKAVSASCPDSFSLPAMASTVGVSTAETWQTESAWVSSKSRPWARAPLTSAAWGGAATRDEPEHGRDVLFAGPGESATDRVEDAEGRVTHHLARHVSYGETLRPLC